MAKFDAASVPTHTRLRASRFGGPKWLSRLIYSELFDPRHLYPGFPAPVPLPTGQQVPSQPSQSSPSQPCVTPHRCAGRQRLSQGALAGAQTMADGAGLRTAPAINRLRLSKSEMRALYRNTTFKALYQEARSRFLIEHFGRRPTLRAGVGLFL